MLSDAPNEFRIVVADPAALEDAYLPIVLAGGSGPADTVRDTYERLAGDPERYYRETVAYYQRLRANTLHIETPDDSLNRAFEWAKVSYDNLVIDNPDLGRGLVAGLGTSGTGGRPGFGWFFGGDTYVNSYSLNSLGAYETVRDALTFLHTFQRDDGKMAHEIAQAAAYVDWFNDYPYAYIHADTSPLYLTAVYDYYRMTGDLDFVQDAWPVIRHAYAWSRATDANSDGLMDNARAGLGALEFGALTGIETDIYLGAAWVRATEAMAEIARAMGDETLTRQAEQDREKARQAFDDKFWDEAMQQYSYAFNAGGAHVQEVTPWSAVGLMWGFGQPDRAAAALRRLSSAELATDWGIRMISSESDRFEP
jgi:glycogen debranching enzyme